MEWLCRYVECTSAAIQALTLFKKLHPGHRREEIENCIAKAAEFIENIQASDGSWFASHCFSIYILHFCLNIILPVNYYFSLTLTLYPCLRLAQFLAHISWNSYGQSLWNYFHPININNLIRYGSWGVCFTYAGWFGIKGLVAAGRTYKNCSSIHKACDYLLSKELASGGWGESYLSCQDKVCDSMIF